MEKMKSWLLDIYYVSSVVLYLLHISLTELYKNCVIYTFPFYKWKQVDFIYDKTDDPEFHLGNW